MEKKKRKKRKKMSEARRKQLARARAVVRRAIKTGLYSGGEELYASLPEMSTQRLRFITRRRLLQQGELQRTDETKKPQPMSAYHGIITKLRNIIMQGKNYNGEYEKKGKRGARDLVNQNARELDIIFETAVSRLGEEEVAKRLKKAYGDMSKLENLLERLMLAVYDDVYAAWADGRAVWERDRREFMMSLEVAESDIPGGLLPYDYNDF